MRRDAQRASSYSHMGKQNIITIVLAMWLMEQKVVIFWCRTDFRDEPTGPEPARPDPARPRRTLTAYFSNVFIEFSLLIPKL